MLGMKNYFDISGSIEIREVDIAGVACIWFYHRLLHLKDTEGMANSVDPDLRLLQSDPTLLPRPVCPKIPKLMIIISN